MRPFFIYNLVIRGGLVFDEEVGDFQSFFLWRRMDMAYCMAMVLMFLKVFWMDDIGSLNLSSSSFIDGMCVAALAPAVITMSGSIFQPRAIIFSINGCICYF
jgi:hypothetical protein